MRQLILVAMLQMLIAILLCAQENLVRNPSFEDTIQCPTSTSQLFNAEGWTININTVDYYNACASNPNMSVPLNAAGYQMASSGDAYAGLYAFGHSNPDANEFLGSRFTTPLNAGVKYYISFKASLSDGQPSLMCGVDKLGLRLTNINWGDTVLIPNILTDNFAHVYTRSTIVDTAKWFDVRGSYIADSAYNCFLIGHFFDSANTQFKCLDTANINNRWSYYYIDDVCVSTDSVECGFGIKDSIPNSIQISRQNHLRFYPNPSRNQIRIDISHTSATVVICNASGKKVFSSTIKQKKPLIDISNFPSGIYFLRVHTAEGIKTAKILVQ